MTEHRTSASDREFRRAFEVFEIAPDDFDHRAHVRLAYVYLCDGTADEAHARMRDALLAFLKHLGIDPGGKYHETMTRAWILAVRHFMSKGEAPHGCADELIEAHPLLLDSKVMLEHYSADLLFSPAARERFVEPDVAPIPEHD